MFSVTPGQIHSGWWVLWIIKLQEWVKAEREKDGQILEDLVTDQFRRKHPDYAVMTDEEVHDHFQRLRKELLRRKPHLMRFDRDPPAMLCLFDLRAKIRALNKDRKGSDGGDENDKERSGRKRKGKGHGKSSNSEEKERDSPKPEKKRAKGRREAKDEDSEASHNSDEDVFKSTTSFNSRGRRSSVIGHSHCTHHTLHAAHSVAVHVHSCILMSCPALCG